CADAVERAAAGNVECLEVLTTEGTVRYLVRRHRQECQQLALGREDVYAALLVRRRLKGRVWLVQSGGDIEPTLLVLLQPVRSPARVPVVQQLAGGQVHGAVFLQIEAPELARAALRVVVIIGDEQVAIIG